MLDKDGTINKLGDDLLQRIIDLLPIKDALRTYVLSSRWRNLCRSISNIDLDDFRFPSKRDGLDSLLDYIDRILVHHDSCNIKSFVSCKAYGINGARINRWISEVMKHNVQELRLGCSLWLDYDKPCVNLPSCLFKSESLTLCEIEMMLPLYGQSIILGSESSLFSVHLPSLKRLKLSNVVFLNHHSAEQFFSNLPKLQQLCLDDCDWDNVNRLSINIPTLEEVDVHITNTMRNLDCQVTIVAPMLTYFECKTSFYIDVLLSHASSHVNVNLIVPAYDEVGDRLAFIRVLESIKNALSLHTNWNVFKWLKVYGIGSKDLPVFDNLKHLEISAQDSSYGEVTLSQIFMLLHMTPSLESLTISLPDANNEDWSGGWYHDDDRPIEKDIPSSCVTSQIKKFSLFSKSGMSSEVYSTAFRLIRYFMEHSV